MKFQGHCCYVSVYDVFGLINTARYLHDRHDVTYSFLKNFYYILCLKTKIIQCFIIIISI